MNPKIKNTIMFVSIAVVLVLAYVFLFGQKEEIPDLVSSSPSPTSTSVPTSVSSATQDFLPVLFNIRNLKLDDAIFSDPAFLSLRDSSIELIAPGDEGRPNPFAPIGSDVVIVPAPVLEGSASADGQAASAISAEQEASP